MFDFITHSLTVITDFYHYHIPFDVMTLIGPHGVLFNVLIIITYIFLSNDIFLMHD